MYRKSNKAANGIGVSNVQGKRSVSNIKNKQ
jgi:hypothetical protein